MSNSISLCMIVKNEAQQIARCINSVKDFVEQVVVVDTGSKDNTAKIAADLGAEVYYYQWQDDFSAARNFSLEQATGQWILFLDADEELDRNTGAVLREMVTEHRYDGYWLSFVNMYNGQPSSSFLSFRLFRNNPHFRFECPIHEQILPSVLKYSSAERIGQAKVTVYHYGYEDQEVQVKNKVARNIRILNKARKQYGEAGFIHFYLGCEYQRLGRYQRALTHYTHALTQSAITDAYTSALVRNMAYCFILLQRSAESMKLVEKYLTIYPDYTDLHYLKGLLYHQQGDIDKSLACMNHCLDLGPPPGQYLSTLGIADQKPREFISDLISTLIRRGQLLTGQQLFSQAYTTLDTVFIQLQKTPDQNNYLKLITAMTELEKAL